MKLTDAQIKQVSTAVAEAEKRTSGEIVPMIVKRSSMVGHVPLQLVLFWLILVLVLHVTLHTLIYNIFSLPMFLTVGVIGAVAFWFLGRCEFLQRLLVPPRDQHFSVLARAQLEFTAQKIQNTVDHTGILIFVSLMERQCVVLADEGIASKLKPETWKSVVDQVIDGVKNGHPAEGLVKAIHTCGDLLSEFFPLKQGDTNELPNELVIKD
jgi:putative membrane protein